MSKPTKKRGRKALIILSVFAALAIILTVYGYVARQDPQRMMENRIVKLEKITYIDLPATRFIGMEVTGEWPAVMKEQQEMWDRKDDFLPVLDAMTEYAVEITDICALMHNNNLDHGDPESRERYLIGKFMRAGAPVPEGFSYYDIPATKAALGIFRGEWGDMMDKAPGKLWVRISKGRYDVPYPDGWFFAEVYIGECVPEEGVVSKMGFLNPCR
ncbi:MAG: GyrI-like domain-containing protein [Oscillospiraceae bacterium]|nr:GyrI-like domain-containing protein [Oscillospiraceae bacterium]